jgi:hypothetical protein
LIHKHIAALHHVALPELCTAAETRHTVLKFTTRAACHYAALHTTTAAAVGTAQSNIKMA